MHYANASPGFSKRVDDMLMEAAEVRTCPECNKCVLLLLNEMHIQEDLVYDEHEGEPIGFTNPGDINDHLDAYEKALSDDQEPPSLVKSVLVFMVQGLFRRAVQAILGCGMQA